MGNAAKDSTARARLARWAGVAPAWLAAMLLLHVVWVAARFPKGSVRKRGEAIDAAQAAGPLTHFPHADGETKRLVAWLVHAVPADEALLYDGPGRGLMEALAGTLAPRLVVHASALAADGTALGRRAFAGQPPWLDAPPTAPGRVTTADGTELRWAQAAGR
jgi:hypothetical protein